MKIMRLILLGWAFTLVAAVFLLSGCAGLDRALLERKAEVKTVFVVNPEGEPLPVTVRNESYQVKPSVAATIDAARTVNRVANPTGSAPVVELGLGGLAAALGWYARRKNLEAKAATAELARRNVL